MSDDIRTCPKLVLGSGGPGKGACWMSAINYMFHGYKGGWSDSPPCVDRDITSVCIFVNDSLTTNEDRRRMIMPVLLEPLGTAGAPPKVRAARAAAFARVVAHSPLGIACENTPGEKIPAYRIIDYSRSLMSRSDLDLRTIPKPVVMYDAFISRADLLSLMDSVASDSDSVPDAFTKAGWTFGMLTYSGTLPAMISFLYREHRAIVQRQTQRRLDMLPVNEPQFHAKRAARILEEQAATLIEAIVAACRIGRPEEPEMRGSMEELCELVGNG